MSYKTDRNISLDLLRIICMLMIVTIHFFSYSNVDTNIEKLSPMFWTETVITVLSGVCVNCYVLISGYFALKSKFRISKLITLLIEVFFYSILIYIILIYCGKIEFSIKDLLFSFFPTLTRQYWFVTSYVGMYVFSPFLKKIGENISRKSFIALILLGFLAFVVYYNLFFFCDNLNFGGATGIVWFSYLYLCGIFINLHIKNNNKPLKYFLLYLGMVCLNILSRTLFYLLYIITENNIFFEGATIFGGVYNSIFVFLESILFFNIFVNLKIGLNKPLIQKIVTLISAASFAVYLVHDNNYLRGVLWGLLDYTVVNSVFDLIIAWIVTVITIYITIIIVDFIRLYLENLIFKKTKLSLILDNKFDNLKNNFLNKIDSRIK